jgi:hypothetical protein
VGQVIHPEAVRVRVAPRCVKCGSSALRVTSTRRSETPMQVSATVWRKVRIQYCECRDCGEPNQKVLAY